MTNLLTIPQEMFIVTLCFIFFAALVGDLGHSKFFRDYKHTPSPWNNLSKDLKALMLALIGFMTFAQNKDSLQIIDDNGLTDAMEEIISGRDPFGLQEEDLILELYGDELMQGGYVLPRDTGITWAVQTGNPPFSSNAVLLVSQFQSGFACVAVTNIQSGELTMPPNAIIFTNWPYAVARQSELLPQDCLPEGFTFGGRPVTNLYMAASGVLSFDAPKSSPLPATNGIPDSTAYNYIAVFQTPSDIVPTNGLFWYAPGTNSSLFTWKDVYLGQDTNCLATVQAELYRDGDFTCRYYFPSPTNSYAQLTNAFLIGAQNLSGGETVLYTNALSAIHSSFLPAFELQWKSLAEIDPEEPDQDDDGIPTADELFITFTDPRLADTDGDGLSDPVEIANATDPFNPDTNSDNIPDGTDLTGYSLSDTNLVFRLINDIEPGVDLNLDSDGDGWADWLEARFGTATNDVNSTPQYSDTLFSVTVTLDAVPAVPGVLSIGAKRTMVTAPGTWTFWLPSGQAHPIVFTAPRGATAPFTVSLNRPDAVRYDKPSPDGKGGDFGKVALPLVTFDPAIVGCCHEDQTAEACETYITIVTPMVPGAYVWDLDGTWFTNAPNEVIAGHDVTFARLRFTPSGATAYRETWSPVKSHCSGFIDNALAGADGTYIIYANTDNDDGDSKIDNEDNYVWNENDMQAATPYTPPQSCCTCPSHSSTNWICKLYAHSDNLRVYANTNKTVYRVPGQTVDADQTVYVEGLVSSTTTDVDYVEWKMEGLTDDGTGGLVETNYIVRSIYTVIDLQAAPVRLEPVTVAANEQGLILNPCGVATNGLAMYKVDVVPTGIVPDSAIHWSIASGDVSFYQSYNTGRTAIIRGGDTPDSDFKLEVTVDGLPSTYKPYILGRVLKPTNILVRAYIICGTNGVPAVSNSTVSAWIDEANRIYRQVAMTFTLASVNSVTNQDWLDIETDDEFYQLASYTQDTRGLELYCVKSFGESSVMGKSNPSSTPGACRGIAVRSGVPAMVFAHEVGHACWLDDIPVWMSDVSPLTQEKAGSLNWSGGADTGYYDPALSHMGLVRSLLLYGKDFDLSIDIPLGSVMSKSTVEPYLETSFAVGLRENMTRNPEH